MLVVMGDWGYDYMTELMVPVLNYITKVLGLHKHTLTPLTITTLFPTIYISSIIVVYHQQPMPQIMSHTIFVLFFFIVFNHPRTQDVATFLVGFHDTDGSGERVSLVDLLLRAIDKAFKDDSGHNDRETRAAANLLSSLFTCAKQVGRDPTTQPDPLLM